MSINIQQIRDNYQAACAKIQNNSIDKKMPAQVEQYKQVAEKERQKMIATDSFAYLEEVNIYIQKYNELQKLFKSRIQKKITSEQLANRANQLIRDNGGQLAAGNQNIASFNPTNSTTINYQNFQNQNQSSSIRRDLSPQRIALNQFFNYKQSNLASDGFRSVLDNPKMQSKNFKKKKHGDDGQYQSLLSQNTRLKNQLRSNQQRNSRTSGMERQLSVVYQKNKSEISSLQQQNSRLMRDNFQLRSQRSTSMGVQQYNQDDYLYSPYTFFTRNNNMHHINMRNLHSQGYQDSDFNGDYVEEIQEGQSPVFGGQHHLIEKKVGYQYENYSEQDYRNQRANVNYSVFDNNRSYNSENGDYDINNSKRYETDKVSTRNKMAFFRLKGILFKNDQIQIGYKRSQADPNSNISKVILYFNNKNREYKTIRIQYDYEQDCYEVMVSQKIRELQGLKQGREVVEVKLRGNRPDFNSIIDANIYVDRNRYRVWLPAMFFKITKGGKGGSNDNEGSKSIYPLKPFSRNTEANKIIQNLQIINSNQAQFYVQSCKGAGPVNLQWKQDKGKLHLRCNRNWLEFFSFIMLDAS